MTLVMKKRGWTVGVVWGGGQIIIILRQRLLPTHVHELHLGQSENGTKAFMGSLGLVK